MTPALHDLGWLFDLDGVLVDTAGLHLAAWRRLAREALGADLPPALGTALRGLSRADSLDRILAALGRRADRRERTRLMALKDGWYRASLAQLGPDHLLPGARALLEELAAAGAPTALVSASRNAPTILARTGLAGLFAHVVDPATICRGKPAPDLYLAAARALARPPRFCIGFEDAPAGIAGLVQAGMAPVAVGLADPRAALCVPTLAALDAATVLDAWRRWIPYRSPDEGLANDCTTM